MASRVHNAARFFGDPDRYLAHNFRIPLRARIVKDLIGDIRDSRILDLGCGDGSISTQFLSGNNHVTMVDFSAGMLDRARRNVPARYESQVKYVRADILNFKPHHPYDLVLCIGVLAHVGSTEQVLATVADCVKPGGRTVLQFSDQRQPLVRLATWTYSIRHRICPASLDYQGMTLAEVISIAARHNLALLESRRHLLLLFPGMARLLGRWLLPYDALTSRSRLLSRHGGDVILLCGKPAVSRSAQSGRRVAT